ncbi:CLUMA_CG013482, isoform A [Clunio marinus]|uniref:CLUMA_CG013482, isoform A n=1 Tax=Clunio marinus TaxID=568069 RepID=A0A1J1IJ31_9DIPT|nr:CLUMA_CG013482, isoform A [Clunio marinus]
MNSMVLVCLLHQHYKNLPSLNKSCKKSNFMKLIVCHDKNENHSFHFLEKDFPQTFSSSFAHSLAFYGHAATSIYHYLSKECKIASRCFINMPDCSKKELNLRTSRRDSRSVEELS